MRYLLAILIALFPTVSQAAVLGYWKCDDNAASSTVVATTGSNASMIGGQNTNTKQASSGPGGSITYSFNCDGTDDGVYAPITRNYGQNFSISLWFKVTSLASEQALVVKPTDATHGITVVDSTTISVRCATTGTVNFTVATMSTDTWYHLFVTRGNSGTDVRVWINGTESTSGTQIVAGAFSVSGWGNTTSFANDLNGGITQLRAFDSDESVNVATYYAEGVSSGSANTNPLSPSIPGTDADPLRKGPLQ